MVLLNMMANILSRVSDKVAYNGLRYLRWGGDGEAVQPEKCRDVEKCLKTAQNPQRQVHAVFARFSLVTFFEMSQSSSTFSAISLFLLPIPKSS
jgi:hypothetical protein